jgi:hypothetical protein
MKRHDMMPAEMPHEEMWTLSEDRLAVPPVPIEGLQEPLRINIGFEADMIDEIINRLTVLRARMLPAPSRRN